MGGLWCPELDAIALASWEWRKEIAVKICRTLLFFACALPLCSVNFASLFISSFFFIFFTVVSRSCMFLVHPPFFPPSSRKGARQSQPPNQGQRSGGVRGFDAPMPSTLGPARRRPVDEATRLFVAAPAVFSKPSHQRWRHRRGLAGVLFTCILTDSTRLGSLFKYSSSKVLQIPSSYSSVVLHS